MCGVCSQKEWVTEGAQEEKRRERALRKTKGTVGVVLAPKAARRQDRRLARTGPPQSATTLTSPPRQLDMQCGHIADSLNDLAA